MRRVQIRLLDLEWGGEFVDNPSQYAFGIVFDMILDGYNGKVCFLVDLGIDLDVQEVHVNFCEVWIPPTTLSSGHVVVM